MSSQKQQSSIAQFTDTCNDVCALKINAMIMELITDQAPPFSFVENKKFFALIELLNKAARPLIGEQDMQLCSGIPNCQLTVSVLMMSYKQINAELAKLLACVQFIDMGTSRFYSNNADVKMEETYLMEEANQVEMIPTNEIDY